MEPWHRIRIVTRKEGVHWRAWSSFSSILVLWLTVPLSAGQDRPDPHRISIHFIDLGIRQYWTPELKIGDPFVRGIWPYGHSNVRTEESRQETPNVVQLLLPMPRNEEIDNLSAEALTAKIYEQLKSSVIQNLSHGKSAFEIQIVQNIGFGPEKNTEPLDKIKDWQERGEGSYFDAAQQERVRKFGQAVGSVITELAHTIQREQHTDPALYFTAASNGGVLFTAAAPLLSPIKNFIKHVDFVESQASVKDTIIAIDAIGAGKFSLSTTKGNYWAPPFRTGNWDAISDVKTARPDVRAFYTVAESSKDVHIKRSAQPGETLQQVAELIVPADRSPTGTPRFQELGSMTGEAMMFQLMGTDFRRAYARGRVGAPTQKAVPSYWTVTGREQSMTEAGLLPGMANGKTKALIVGKGSEADAIYQGTVERLGEANVLRIHEEFVGDSLDLQHKARAFGAEIILAAKNPTHASESATSSEISSAGRKPRENQASAISDGDRPPVGGIAATIQVESNSFSRSTSDSLRELKSNILKTRSSTNQLAWPLKQ